MVIVIISVVTVYLLIGGMISTVAIAQGHVRRTVKMTIMLTLFWLPFTILGFIDAIRKL